MNQGTTIYSFRHRGVLNSIRVLIGMIIFVIASNVAYATAPTVTTLSATNITKTSATLRGKYTNQKLASAYSFQYGTTSSYGTTIEGRKYGATSKNETFEVSCNITGLRPGTTYHFRLVAFTDALGEGADMTFTTEADAKDPTTPYSPSPSNGATDIATSGSFSWSTSPNDGNSQIGYDLYLGMSSGDMSLYDSGSGTSCSYSGLLEGKKYYWKVIAYNSSNKSSQSSTWSFTTKTSAVAPSTPSSPSPSDGATEVSTSGTLSWSCSSNDGNSSLSYDLYMGTSTNNMSLYKSGSGTSCSYSGLSEGKKYYWKLIAYNSSGLHSNSPTWSFTTKESTTTPSVPNNPSPSDGATGVAVNGMLSWSATGYAYAVYLGKESSNLTLYTTASETKAKYVALDNSQTYYWRVDAYDKDLKEFKEGPVWRFTTEKANYVLSNPRPANGETDVEAGTVLVSCDGYDTSEGTTYEVEYSDNAYFKNSMSSNTRKLSNVPIKAETPNTTYYWRVMQYDSSNMKYVQASPVWNFTTSSVVIGDCDLPDVDKSSAYYKSTCYLYSFGIISGSDIDGKMKVEEKMKRAHLAKIAFRGVYSLKGREVPTSVPSDNYPTVYGDLTDKSTYYYQAARALLYLEYGDGVTPFDRNRLQFAPEEEITRLHTLKVLMETFNIQPDMSGTNNPFTDDADVVALTANNPRMMGYIRKAASLGIITTANSKFRPNDNCLRGEAFIMLARIMQMVENGSIADPNPSKADYFEPLNTTLATISLGASLSMGNFQHYTKSSFALSGTVPLAFVHTYNSYNTTLPEVFYGANSTRDAYLPLGDGWSHNYHTFVTSVDDRAIVHWGGGNIDVYAVSGSQWKPVSIGVYDEFTISGNTIYIKTKQQMTYCFGEKKNGVAYLTSITDRNGNTLSINYTTGVDDMPRISSVSDGNRSLTFSYLSGTNLVSSLSDPLGRNVQFGYTKNSQTDRYQLTSFTDAKSQQTTYNYGDNSKISTSKLLARIQMPKGNYIENEYDANRRLKKTESGVNGVPTTQTSVSVAASYGNTVQTTSRLTVDRGTQSSSYNYTFNANNMVTGMTGEEGLYVNNTYNNSAHPQLPTSISTNSTDVSNVSYDDKGNIISLTVTGDGTLTTSMTYDAMNNLTSVTDPKGYKTTYTYDSKGNLTDVSAPEGVTVNISVDSKGLPVSVTNAMGAKTTFEYNSYGNLTKTTLSALNLSSTAEYDNASRLTSSTDALGRTTKYVYDNNDNLTSSTDPASHTTSYDYDSNDNLTGITNAKGGVTSMSYDNATDWLRSVSFNGATKQYSYNTDGTLASLTKPDGTVLNYTYDDLGRITSDGVNTYSYDSQLRLASVSDNDKTMSLTYDGFNRIIGTTCNGHSNTYSYDNNGNCTAINDVNYRYDQLNRMTSVKFNGKTISYTYRKDSKLSSVSYPNGMTTTFEYDDVGRLTSKQTKLSNGTVIAGYTYTLDKVGNITQQSTHEPFSEISLINEDVSYSYNSGNRITKAGDISFSFDENGNTTKRGSEAYSWDKNDRLTQAGATSITYDPLGLISSYGDITFTVDPLGIGNVIGDSKSGATYIYGNGLEARVKDGKVSYYVTDVRGSVVAIVDEDGNITHKYQYDEFGRVTQKEEADYNPFQYVGGYGVIYLSEHLYYMRARHYDPTIGRFLSEDPVWSTNLYPYADNNPIMGIDPQGTNTLFSNFVDIVDKGIDSGINAWDATLDKIGEGIYKFGGDKAVQIVQDLANGKYVGTEQWKYLLDQSYILMEEGYVEKNEWKKDVGSVLYLVCSAWQEDTWLNTAQTVIAGDNLITSVKANGHNLMTDILGKTKGIGLVDMRTKLGRTIKAIYAINEGGKTIYKNYNKFQENMIANDSWSNFKMVTSKWKK